MLVVMGIIVLLLAATLPALRGLNQSESRRGAVGNMLGVLDRARMMAISDGLATYVVFACPADPSQINADLRGRAYAIYEDSDNVTFTPTQKTPWMQLPKGMAFKVNASDPTYTSVTNCQVLLAFSLTGSAAAGGPGTSASVALPYWKFDGTGVVVDPPAPPSVDANFYRRLLIFPGVIDASDNEISTQNSGGPGNKQSTLLEEIDVNTATGRAKYIIDPANNLSTPSST